MVYQKRCTYGKLIDINLDNLRHYVFILTSFSFREGKEVGKRGAKRKLTPAEFLPICDDIDERARTLKAMDVKEVKERAQLAILAKKGLNEYADKDTFAPISVHTIKSYMKEAELMEVKGKDQAEGREEAFNDIRNAIAKAAGLGALARIVRFEHIHSTDEVGLFLFGWHITAKRPKLVVSPEAQAWLRQNNTSVSKSIDPNQQRCVHIGTTQGTGGQLTAIYLRIVDSNIPDFQCKQREDEFKPWIFCLNERRHVYAVVSNQNVKESIISEYIGIHIDSKAIHEKQEIAIEEELRSLRAGVFAGLVFAEGSEPPTPEDLSDGILLNPTPSSFQMNLIYVYLDVIAAVKEKHKHALLLRDGCSGQITASPAITAFNKGRGRSQLHGKYSAGCSMTQSWNDVGHCHDALHRLVEHDEFIFKEYSDPEGANYAALKAFLEKHIESASLETYWKFICCFEPYILKAMSPVAIKSSVKASGFDRDNKIDTWRIMSFNPQFAAMAKDNAQRLVSTIEDVLVPYFEEHKHIPENVYDDLFGDDPNIILGERQGRPLNDLTINRQRFIIDNSDEFREIIEAREAGKRAASEAIERRRLERQERQAALPLKYRSCWFLGCPSIIDITTPAVKKRNESIWKSCAGKGCKVWTCPGHCDMIPTHEAICLKCTARTVVNR